MANGNKSINLDNIDLVILDLLQQDGRITHAAIGKEVNLTGPSVYARVQRLEQSGTIKQYTAMLDASKLGLILTAFILVQSRGGTDEIVPFEKWVLAEPRILECHEVDGEYTYLLKAKIESPEVLRVLLGEILSFDVIARTVTSIALYTVKEMSHLSLPTIDD